MGTKILFFRSIIVFSLIVFSSCSNTDEDDMGTLSLPPEASMVMDFESFNNQQAKTELEKAVQATEINNWGYSAIVVGVWNTALVTTLAVPVASFRSALHHKATYKGNALWEWNYTVDGFTSQYAARLTGEVAGNEVHWKMYITKTGIGAFDEFMWFSGVSNIDGKTGYWILNHSAEFPENMMRIDWTIEDEEVASIKYTYTRELNDNRQTDAFKSSFISYGIQTGEFDVFYDLHAYDYSKQSFVDADIEWHRTNYNGRVMSESYFGDSDWHCWNDKGENKTCE